ncbi:MAG: glycoside hydrolase family 99-like domain-containing protein [Mycobacterium sp.]|nr:glycoside hydrolase family 99-like domain-containing protein [Mycobacterium sp.]
MDPEMASLRSYANQILSLPAESRWYEPRRPEAVVPAEGAPKPVCFYLPQFHTIPENDAWWGEGFTEWTNVTRAVPQYIGHDQPRLPDALGFYDLSHLDPIRRQVELARHYGIHGFCFYYYWFSGRRILEKPLELFLAAADIDFPFCICWANEDWTRGWNGGEDILLQQDHHNENPEQFALDVAPILRDPRYIRVGGKPLLIIYRPPIIPDFAARMARWREVLRREGVGEVAVYMIQGFLRYDPRPWGCDGAIEFPPHNIGFHHNPSEAGAFTVVNPNYSGIIVTAETVLKRARHSQAQGHDYPWIRGCNPSWDNEARRPGRGWTMHGTTPDFFERWLRHITGEGHPGPVRNPENYVFINAWNEWAEGAYLEPDRRFGYAHLNRIARVLQPGG